MIDELQQTGGGEAVDSQIDPDEKRQDLQCGRQSLFGTLDEVVVDRGVMQQSVGKDQCSHDRDECGRNRSKKSLNVHAL